MANMSQVTILLVEDDPGHARLLQKNLHRAGLSNQVIHLTDGQQALDFLNSEGSWAGNRRPSPLLVLLDLNMPVLDGYQVLTRMKASSELRYIPVIILTTTDDVNEVKHCYDLGCSIYITKPINYNDFVEAVRKLGLFLSVVTIPNGN
ncbi:MAG: response regulator [Anaerolineae bacterium]|nr:response regulator [Anaerolineae bacterium]